MFFFFSKFLPLFILPPGLITLLLIVALLFRRKTAVSTPATTLALLILLLSSNPIIAQRFAKTLEWRHLPERTPTNEVLVLLGGGTTAGYYPQPIAGVNDAGDRLLYAAHLYQQGNAQKIVLSGGTLPGNDSSDAEEMAAILLIMGVAKADLIYEEQSVNTYENGRFTKQLLDEMGINRVTLVTSALHMPRAKAVFEKQGIQVDIAPTDFYVQKAEWTATPIENRLGKLFDFVPSIDALSLTTKTMREYMGLAIYRLRGWV